MIESTVTTADSDSSFTIPTSTRHHPRRLGLLKAPLTHFAQIWQRRALVSFMVSGNLKAPVINTVLGRLWHLIPPIVQIAVYFVVVNYIFSRGGDGPKALFVTISVGILHWSFLNQTITTSANSIISNENLLKQAPIPPIIFVSVLFREQLQHLAVKIGILAVIVLGLGPIFTWRLALYPIWIALLLLNTWTLSLIVATLSVFFRDLEKATGIIFLMLMYLCPVIYGIDFLVARIGPVQLVDILMLNPLAVNMAMLKWSLLASPAPAQWQIALAGLSSLFMFLVAHQVYERCRASITKSL